jgi:DNA repair exonuclease SbcCD nuclease subunit
MSFSFIHLADTHLGYEQYGNTERFLDFGQAFLEIVQYAISKKVDFVLLSGDMFNKRSINPKTLLQATTCLKLLKDNNIPLFCVEGNHDRAHFSDQMSWMNYLSREGLLHLLSPDFGKGKASLRAWTKEKGGAFYDINEARIYGIKYLGSATEIGLQTFSDAFKDSDRFNILMMHAGLEGYVPNISGMVDYHSFLPLREKIDYVALGHIHKYYMEDDWIYNPGAPETWSIDEYGWKKGFFFVKVSDSVKVTLIENARRKFIRLHFNADNSSNLYQELEEYLENNKTIGNPVVELTIRGSIARNEIHEERIKEIINSIYSPIVIRLRFETQTSDYDVIFEGDRREDFELDVIQKLLYRHPIFDGVEERFAKAIVDLKKVFISDFTLEKVDMFLEDLIDAKIPQKIETSEIKLKHSMENQQPDDFQEEEVWDWRKCYDKKSVP